MEVLEKGNIGKMKLKNRIVMTPMGTAYDPDGGFSKRNINYYTGGIKEPMNMAGILKDA